MYRNITCQNLQSFSLHIFICRFIFIYKTWHKQKHSSLSTHVFFFSLTHSHLEILTLIVSIFFLSYSEYFFPFSLLHAYFFHLHAFLSACCRAVTNLTIHCLQSCSLFTEIGQTSKCLLICLLTFLQIVIHDYQYSHISFSQSHTNLLHKMLFVIIWHIQNLMLYIWEYSMRRCRKDLSPTCFPKLVF